MNNCRSGNNSSNGSNSSQSKKTKESSSQKPAEETHPTTPPLGSSQEPSRAYPSDPSRDYASDPSKYAYPPKNGGKESNASYTTESGDQSKLSEEPKLGSHQFQQEDYQKKYAREDMEEERRGENMRRGRDRQNEDFADSSRYSKAQVITYVALAIGLLILFFNGVLGGFIIGAVAGYHFADEIIYYIRHLPMMFRGPNHLRSLTLGALLLALFIAIPSLFIGAALVAVFKQFLMGTNHYPKNNRPPYS